MPFAKDLMRSSTRRSRQRSKSDRVIGFVVHVEGLVSAADNDVKRLQSRKAFYLAVVSASRFPSSAQSRILEPTQRAIQNTRE